MYNYVSRKCLETVACDIVCAVNVVVVCIKYRNDVVECDIMFFDLSLSRITFHYLLKQNSKHTRIHWDIIVVYLIKFLVL